MMGIVVVLVVGSVEVVVMVIEVIVINQNLQEGC